LVDALVCADQNRNGVIDFSVPADPCQSVTWYWGDQFVDSDGDFVADEVDPGDPAGAFDDGEGTSGQILATNGLSVEVLQAPAPDGVRVLVNSGTGTVSVSLCGGFQLSLNAGSDVTLTCGSAIVQVVTGSAEFSLPDGTLVQVPEGVKVEVSDLGGGEFLVKNLGGGDVTVVQNGASSTVGDGKSKTISGDQDPPVVNPVASPAANGNGWWKTDVNVAWNRSDTGSGIDPATARRRARPAARAPRWSCPRAAKTCRGTAARRRPR
jgi:hypothetical protein